MATTIELQEFQRIIENAFRLSGRTSGTSTGGAASPADRAAAAKDQQILKDNSSAMKYLRKTLKKNGELLTDMNHITKASNKVFHDVVNSVSDLKELDKLPAQFRKSMEKSGSMFVKSMADNIESLEDMFAVQSKVENLPQVKALMKEFAKGKFKVKSFQEKLEKLGYSTEEASSIINRFDKDLITTRNTVRKSGEAQERAAKVVDSFDAEIKEANQRIRDFGSGVDLNKEKLKGFGKKVGAVAVLLGKELYTAAKASMKFGTEVNLVRSRLAGMAPEEYSRLQAQNRQAINALTGGFTEFDSLVGDASKDMILFTGSLKAGAELGASLITTSRLLGNANVDTAAFVKSQEDVFKMFNRQLSMTSEEFSAMNERLVQDMEIRSVLYRQSQEQRQAHFEGLQMQIKTYRTWGLLQDQAEALAKTMDRMSGKDAKTRMREAARLRATMGAMGLGAQGEEAQKLMMKGSRMTGDEQKRLAEIMKSANEVTAARMGESFQSELLTSAMIQRAGLEEYLGPNSSFVNATLATGAGQKGTPQNAPEQWMSHLDGVGSIVDMRGSEIVEKITTGFETLISFLSSGFIAALVASLASSTFGRGLMALAGKGKGLLGSIVSGGRSLLNAGGAAMMGETATAGVGSLAAGGTAGLTTLAGGVAAAALGGYALGTAIDKMWESWAPDSRADFGQWLGSSIDEALSFFGDDDAKRRLEVQEEMLQYQKEQLELQKQQSAAASQTANNTAKTHMAVQQQTQSQQDEAAKALDQERTNQRFSVMRVPRTSQASL